MDVVSGYRPKQVVASVAELEAILGEQFDSQVDKVIDHVDDHCRAWIERSPFVVVSTSSAAGAMDVSPKGDPPGFVRVLDAKTLAIPDRPGNHRGDSFRRRQGAGAGPGRGGAGGDVPLREVDDPLAPLGAGAVGSDRGAPDYAQALVDHAALDTPLDQVEWMMNFNEEHRLYDD